MDREMMWKLIRSGNRQQIQALPPSQLEEFLLSVLDDSESAREPADFDRLLSLGVSLARSGHEDADEAALRWLGAHPSAKRLDIASAFLIGLWNRAFRSSPVRAERAEKLIQAHAVTLPDADAEYSFVQALCQILKSEAVAPLKDRVAGVLEAVSRRDYEPVVKQMIESVIRDAAAYGRR